VEAEFWDSPVNRSHENTLPCTLPCTFAGQNPFKPPAGKLWHYPIIILEHIQD
jgi:hypothetical protein